MMWQDAVIPILRWLTLAGMIFVWMRLRLSGLHRRYRVFSAYLVFSSIRSGILLTVDVRSGTYMKVWVLTEPVLWVFYILMVLELYSLILESHKGLYTAGRWAMWAALTLAFLSALFSLATPYGGAFYPNRMIGLYMLVERGLLFSLVVFLFLLLAFLSRYPVRLSRNVVVHAVIYSVFFLFTSLTFLVRSMLGWQVARPINTLFMAIAAACVLAWAVLLSRKGESETRTGISLHHGDESRLLLQLDAMNATLLRVARK